MHSTNLKSMAIRSENASAGVPHSHTHTDIRTSRTHDVPQDGRQRHNYQTWWQCDVVVSGVCRMNEVNPRRARLVSEWVIVFGRVCHLIM